MADKCGQSGSGLENQSQEVGRERKSEEEEVQGEILDHQEEQGLSKELHEGRCEEVVKNRCGASKELGSACSGNCPQQKDSKLKRQMAAAVGKKSTTSLYPFMEAYGLEVEEELSTLATQYWAEGAWRGKWHHEQKEAWMKQVREVQVWRQVRVPAGAVMCETRDLGFKWPH